MNLLFIALLLQSLLLPPRTLLPNPAVDASVPPKIKKDYDKAWTRFLAGKEDDRLKKDLESLLKKQKDLDAVILIQAYLDLYKADDTQAAQKFEQVLARKPENRVALYYLAELAFARSDYARASDLYMKLLVVDKTRTDIEPKREKALLLATEGLLRYHAEMAEKLAKDNKWDEALTHYKKQTELAGANDETEKKIAEALMHLGRTEEAREILNKLRNQGTVDESLEIKVKELEDLGRWGKDIDYFRMIESSGVITREELAAVLVRYFPQIAEFRQNPQVVIDIQDSWARTEIQTVVGVGVIEPHPNHTFQPLDAMTRAEFSVALSRLIRLLGVSPAGAPPVPVSDVSSTHALYRDVQRVLSYGLMSLDDTGNFNIGGSMSGEEAVRAVGRLLDLSRR